MLTAQDGISQDLDDILDGVAAIEGVRPVFLQWTSHDGAECRLYRMKGGICSKLVTIESDTQITDHQWIDEK